MPAAASWLGHNDRARYIDLEALTERAEPNFTLEAATSNSPIKLQILLRGEWRTAAGIEEVRKLLASLGLKPTASGLATISAEAEPAHFESLFRVKASELAPPTPGGSFGISGAPASADLAVPQQLAKYVASISAAPTHTYLRD